MKRILVFTMMLVFTSTLLMATGAIETTGSETSPITLQAYTNLPWPSPQGVFAERLAEKTGVTLQVTHPLEYDPQGTQVTLMMASNDMPDFMYVGWGMPTTADLIEGEYLWDVNELLDTYAPDYKAWLNKWIGPELLGGAYASDDGKTYQIPFGGNLGSADSQILKDAGLGGVPKWAPTFNVRKDYYEEIGSPEIRNADDFLAAVEAMHENHPENWAILGDKNTRTDWFAREFGLEGTLLFDLATKEVKFYTSSPKFEEMIVFMNLLARKGLYPKEAMIWVPEVAQEWVAGRINFQMGNFGNVGAPVGDTSTTLVALPPWDDYQGVQSITPWLTNLFPKASKKSERAIKFIQFMASPEGWALYWSGIGPGDTWTGDVANGPHWQYRPDMYQNGLWPKGFPIWFDEFSDMMKADYNGTAAKAGLYLAHIVRYDVVSLGGWSAWEGPAGDPAFQAMMGPHWTAGPEYSIPIKDSSDVGIIRQKVGTLFDDYYARMVFAESEAECLDALAEFRTKANEVGLAQWEAEATRIFRANLAKAGK